MGSFSLAGKVSSTAGSSRENVRHSKAHKAHREMRQARASSPDFLRMGVLMVFEHSLSRNLGLVSLIKDREADWFQTLGNCVLVWP